MIDTTGAAPAVPRLTAAHLSLAALGLMWTLPFLQPYHHVPLPSFYSEWIAVALGLLALTLLARAAYRRSAALPGELILLLAFAALLVLQYATGRVAYGGQVLLAGLYLVWAALLVVLASALRRAIGLEGIVTLLAWFLAVGGTIGAVLALLQHYQISDLPQSLIFPKRRAELYGNVAQNNHFASYSTLALASLAYLYASRRMHGAVVAAGVVPLVIVIGLSGSRSALLFLGLVLGLALLYAWRSGAGGRRLAGCMLLVIVAFGVGLWLAALPQLASDGGTATVSQRLIGGEGSSGAKSLNFRLQIAREAWDMFTQAPFLGVGWGQFPVHDFDYRARHGHYISTWPFNHAHNIVLHLMAETGLAGALLVLGAALLWVRRLRHAPIDLQHWWLVALLGVIALQSLLEHPLWYAYFLGMAAIALGLLPAGDARPRLERAGGPLMILVLVVGAIYGALLLDRYRDFEWLFARGAVQPGTAAFAATVGRAHRDPALAPYAELAIVSVMSVDGARVREKREINSRVMRFAPISSVVYRQAMLLALEGERAAAERELVRAARVYPDDLPAVMKVMSEAALQHPEELTPLIKLAAVKHAERRAALERR